jgi:hypothetical protein
MNPLQSLVDYELFIYLLPQHYPAISYSSLVAIQRGGAVAVIRGEIELHQDLRIVVREKLSFADLPGVIESYGYEIWRGEDLLYWYDSQAHPNTPTLVSTHPHHKHIPPDIKHNRIPAPGLSFTRPNLPFLIEEIERDMIKNDTN